MRILRQKLFKNSENFFAVQASPPPLHSAGKGDMRTEDFFEVVSNLSGIDTFGRLCGRGGSMRK
jgi:hypothetical protein